MKTLLTVQVDRNGYTLRAWFQGGKHIRFRPPFRPHFYIASQRQGDPVQRIFLSDLHTASLAIVQPRNVWLYNARNVYKVRDTAEQVAALEVYYNFIEQISVEKGFKQKVKDLKCVGYDVEATSSSGQFPNPKREDDRVIATALWGRHYQRHFEDDDEATILEKTADGIKRADPDIIFDYSGTGFDYDFPLKRAHMHHNMRWPLGRLQDEPYIRRKEYTRKRFKRTETTTYLEGRICMDVYREVLFDPSLTGMRRGLKNVGRHMFGEIVDVVELDRQRLRKATKEDLGRYCFSDARLACLLGEHYLRVISFLADRFQVPLAAMVHRKPSHIGNLFYGRNYKPMNIISDGGAEQRLEMALR